jgi:cytochrome c oxidase subunit 2
MSQDSFKSQWIDPYEKIWIVAAVVVLIGMITATTIAAFAMGIQVPTPERQVDPRIVGVEGPFSQPGLRDLGGGKYEAYILAQAWQWNPKEIRIPVGSTVTFFLTSKDVQHGFHLWDTNLNVMVLPGQVSKVTVTFDEAGEYPYICNEYCGVGHHTMDGVLIVEEQQ